MGIFTVEARIRNWQNRFLPPEEQGEDVTTEALVDTGAVGLCLPAEMIEQLKLIELDTIRVETADGAFHNYRVMGIAEVEVQGRSSRVQVIELPRGARPLLGAVPLEEMDWHISPAERKLIPNPRSPDGPMLPLMRGGLL
ncbi:MAG: clan AA aspartic protease [Chloroflexi bacterium]|nr:clan AA aspartic protease [Chloroflexota bacterium]